MALVVCLLIVSQSCASCRADLGGFIDNGSTNQQTVEVPAQFEVGPLDIQRDSYKVGSPVSVTAHITNVGGKPGTYLAILTLNGEEIDRAIAAIVPKQTAKVSFEFILNTLGTSELTIGESKAVITTYEWPFMIYYDADTRLGGIGPEHGSQSYGTVQALAPPISIGGDYGHLVRFKPPVVPFQIHKILINGEGRVSNKDEWDSRQVTVRIWDDNHNILWSAVLPWRLFRYPGDWNEIVIPNLSVSGNFNVELVTHSGEQGAQTVYMDYSDDPSDVGIYIGWDRPQTYIAAPADVAETHSFISYMGKIVEVPEKYQGLNWYIRVIGEGN